MKKDDVISTVEAAKELGVTRQRVLQLISEGRLKASRFANAYMIYRRDLDTVRERAPGRPPKDPKAAKRAKGKK